jgi:hypothetical protein
MGEVLLLEGRPLEALAHLRKSFEIGRRYDSPLDIADAAVDAARCAARLGSDEIAARLYGFGRQEMASAGFPERDRYFTEAGEEIPALQARLGVAMSTAMEVGSRLTREQVAELLAGLENNSGGAEHARARTDHFTGVTKPGVDQ